MTILVTGGAGYIGSVTVELLTRNGESIVVLDDLSYGHREAIDADIPFYQAAAGNRGFWPIQRKNMGSIRAFISRIQHLCRISEAHFPHVLYLSTGM